MVWEGSGAEVLPDEFRECHISLQEMPRKQDMVGSEKGFDVRQCHIFAHG